MDFYIIILLTLLPIIGWTIFCLVCYVRPIPRSIIQTIPSGFTMTGVLGTFIGIVFGLWDFDVENISGSIPLLLEGLKYAFTTSILGIIFSIVSAKIIEFNSKDNESLSDNQDTALLRKISKLLESSNEQNAQNFRKFDAIPEIISALSQNFDDVKSLISSTASAQSTHYTSLLNHNTKETNRLIQTLNTNNEELSQKIAEMNSKELLKAMERSAEAFNEKMKELLERLVKENFEILNRSVKQLNDWQVTNMKNMEQLIEEQQNLIQENGKITKQFETTAETVQTNFDKTSTDILEIVTNTKKITDENSRLNKILRELESVAMGDNQFKSIITQAESSITNMNAATEQFSIGMEQTEKLNNNVYRTQESLVILMAELQKVAKFNDINGDYWKDVKEKMNEGIGLLNDGSKSISDSLDSVDTEFRERLQDTFESLDKLMKGYLVNN